MTSCSIRADKGCPSDEALPEVATVMGSAEVSGGTSVLLAS